MKHVNDQELLMLHDGELPSAERSRVSEHLSECSECRKRHDTLKLLSDELQATSRASLRPISPYLRARLQATLQESAATADRLSHRERLWHMLGGRRLFFPLGAAVPLVVLLFVSSRLHQSNHPAPVDVRLEPNPKLTPGVVKSVSLPEVCSLSDNDLDPNVSPEVRRAIFEEYGIGKSSESDYQVDYLVSPQLGGKDDLGNLWPEPYHETVWNAAAKDALETKLHSLVCDGRIGLEQAQRDLTTDWIGAYKRYFHAAYPENAHTAKLEPLPLQRDSRLP